MPSAQILADFSQFLTNQRLSLKTCRNYRSDVGQFLAWLAPRSPSGLSLRVDDLGEVGSQHFQNYKTHLQSRCAGATLNRHLSALRQFCSFLQIDLPLDNIQLPLIPTIIKNFRSHLVKNRYKHKTIANYVSDIKHYLNWTQSRL